jgi:hypothetical protein
MQLGPDDKGRTVLTSKTCGTFIRLVRRLGDPEPGLEPRPPGTSEYAYDTPPAGSWWLGMIRQRDDIWRPVTLSPTHRACWDGLLYYPGEGDRLTVPTDPPTRPTAKTDQEAARG